MKTSSNDYSDSDGDFGEYDKNDESAARENGVVISDPDKSDSEIDSDTRKKWWKRAWSWTKNIFGY